ncbi:DoxX family protein [Mucilaginibacter sp. McL0603]|uniref:DoxX family protein n=1 Tax=Mucilaginibacter sp. McL0603 TaxID=3415670 RepID=UPI003CE7EBDD
MMDLIKTILYSDAGTTVNNWALLGFRVLLALELFRVHGMKKFKLVNGQKVHEPNPFHLPEKLNGLVATFADTVVPCLVILGIGTRIAVLPTLGVTATGYFVVHRKDSVEVRDVPYMYTLCFLFLMIVGAGIFSADHYFYKLLTDK